MIYPRYIVCPVCRCVTRLNADEEEVCAYCGVNIQEGKKASKSQWRGYWIVVVMQPYSLNTVKKTKQLSLNSIQRRGMGV